MANRPSDGASEIPGAPEYIWFLDWPGWPQGEPHREPGGESLGWTPAGRPPRGPEYGECNPLVEVGRKDVEDTNWLAGYLRDETQQAIEGWTWTRYRKVEFAEALRRRAERR